MSGEPGLPAATAAEGSSRQAEERAAGAGDAGSEERGARALPRLELAPVTPAELLYERLHEPSTDNPILYRERAYLVDTLQSDDELEEHLEAELSRIRRDWRYRDASQFVHLALFDQRLEGELTPPPVATLSWKDWQGRTEIWVRGVRRSTLPPGMPPSVAPPGAEPAPRELETLPPPQPVLETLPPPPETPRSPSETQASAALSSAPPEPASVERARTASEPGEGLAGVEGVELVRPQDVESIPLIRLEPLESAPHSAREAAGSERDERGLEDAPPDSGPAWQSPGKSGEYLIPLPDEALAPPPSSQRVLAGEELMGALFERLHELGEAPGLAAGAECVLVALAEHVPCDGALAHRLDLGRGELEVIAAFGPNQRDVIGRRTPLAASAYEQALRQREPLELAPAEVRRRPGPWRALGVVPWHAIVSLVQAEGEAVGIVELCRGAGRGPFNPGQISALVYASEQLAEVAVRAPERR